MGVKSSCAHQKSDVPCFNKFSCLNNLGHRMGKCDRRNLPHTSCFGLNVINIICQTDYRAISKFEKKGSTLASSHKNFCIMPVGHSL